MEHAAAAAAASPDVSPHYVEHARTRQHRACRCTCTLRRCLGTYLVVLARHDAAKGNALRHRLRSGGSGSRVRTRKPPHSKLGQREHCVWTQGRQGTHVLGNEAARAAGQCGDIHQVGASATLRLRQAEQRGLETIPYAPLVGSGQGSLLLLHLSQLRLREMEYRPACNRRPPPPVTAVASSLHLEGRDL